MWCTVVPGGLLSGETLVDINSRMDIWPVGKFFCCSDHRVGRSVDLFKHLSCPFRL